MVIPLRSAAPRDGADAGEVDDDPVLVVHPNYVVE